jgi:hypothetical protein
MVKLRPALEETAHLTDRSPDALRSTAHLELLARSSLDDAILVARIGDGSRAQESHLRPDIVAEAIARWGSLTGSRIKNDATRPVGPGQVH